MSIEVLSTTTIFVPSPSKKNKFLATPLVHESSRVCKNQPQISLPNAEINYEKIRRKCLSWAEMRARKIQSSAPHSRYRVRQGRAIANVALHLKCCRVFAASGAEDALQTSHRRRASSGVSPLQQPRHSSCVAANDATASVATAPARRRHVRRDVTRDHTRVAAAL